MFLLHCQQLFNYCLENDSLISFTQYIYYTGLAGTDQVRNFIYYVRLIAIRPNQYIYYTPVTGHYQVQIIAFPLADRLRKNTCIKKLSHLHWRSGVGKKARLFDNIAKKATFLGSNISLGKYFLGAIHRMRFTLSR